MYALWVTADGDGPDANSASSGLPIRRNLDDRVPARVLETRGRPSELATMRMYLVENDERNVRHIKVSIAY